MVKDTLEKPDPEKHDSKKPKHPLTYKAVTLFYDIMRWINAVVVLMGGSIFQVTGVLQNCWCKSGIVGWNANSSVLLSTNTYTHQYWAKTLWLKIGYVAYAEVGFFCVVALWIRLYVARSIRRSLISDRGQSLW